MSLAKRNNGCVECRMRRIRCDKEEPECFKCRKKGLCCSGQGIEYRFSSHMSAPRSPTGDTHGPHRRKNRPGSANSPNRPSARKPIRSLQQETGRSPGSSSASSSGSGSFARPADETPERSRSRSQTPVSQNSESGEAYGNYELVSARPGHGGAVSSPLRGALEPVAARSRMFFDHFSNFIAAKMVVYDFSGNGYRQIILPLACQDAMVEQAVSTIAAFHLAQEAPQMREAAETAQQAILTRLYHQSLHLEPQRLFNMATWATILILLVGDTITGSKNYVHLLGLLSCLARSSVSVNSLSEGTRSFIAEQTRMFELFGLPLSSEKKGLDALALCPDFYLDFMTACPSQHLGPEKLHTIDVMKSAIRQACSIYRGRAQHTTSSQQSVELVERMQSTVAGLDPKEDGCHALVWAYFVAAAESTLPHHREFFINRLRNLFECTRFGSIPLALETLQIIWSAPSSAHWTDVVTRERPILIM